MYVPASDNSIVRSLISLIRMTSEVSASKCPLWNVRDATRCVSVSKPEKRVS